MNYLNSYQIRHRVVIIAAVGTILLSAAASSQEIALPTILTPNDARLHGFESLKTVVQNEGVPLPNNLNPFISDRQAARRLGKAFFYDMAVGSDGIQSCAACHFHAGADSRSKNQLSPGLMRVRDQRVDDTVGYFNADGDADSTFQVGTGPNYSLFRSNFPFVTEIGNGENVTRSSDSIGAAPGNVNDVASSQGIRLSYFTGIDTLFGGSIDEHYALTDDDFQVKDSDQTQLTTRRVEPRNTPTVINSVFNFANFWDGRANNRFNGENPFGKQDKVARIFKTNGKNIVAVPLNLKNASLASQAVGPPLSHFEMSFGNGADSFRIFPQVGRKLLKRQALVSQSIDPNDSLLGNLRNPQGNTPTYEALIKAAFNSKYWNSDKYLAIDGVNSPAKGNQFSINNGRVRTISVGRNELPPSNAYSLMESNFAFFYGISLMLYQATLVSDETPFDNWMRSGSDPGFGSNELAGLQLFTGKGNCSVCHIGPELTGASVRATEGGNVAIEPMVMGNQLPALYDTGYYNIGVTPTTDDLARGDTDPFGAPLAFSRQFAFDALGIQKIKFPITGAPLSNVECGPTDVDLDNNPLTCDSGILGFNDLDFGLGFFEVCQDLNADGLCGVDDKLLLQRVAVDGAFKTPGLRNVELTGPYFHNGGMATLREVVQFYNRGGNFCRFNRVDLDPEITGLGLSAVEEEQLVAFLMSLTDPRVARKQAPFDYPQILIPLGHVEPVQNNTYNYAVDDLFTINAVGRGGVSMANKLKPFLNADQQSANTVKGGICDTGLGLVAAQ